MKLPTITTRPAGQLGTAVTPNMEAAKASNEMQVVAQGLNAASDAYREITSVAVSRSEAKARKEYVERWGALAERDSITTAELDELGVSFDPNMAREAPIVGPGGEQQTAQVVPTWAVADEAHRVLTAQLQDKHRPTATEAAARRFEEKWGGEFTPQRQAEVSDWATKKRRGYLQGELQDAVTDFLEAGDYGGAQESLNRAFAGGVVDTDQYEDTMSKIMEVKEVSGYIDTIENGDFGQQADLLTELLEGIEEGSETYNGELTVPERQTYIRQLRASMKAIADGSSDKSMAGLYVSEFKDMVSNNTTPSPVLIRQARDVVGRLGNERQRTELEFAITSLSERAGYYAATTGEADAILTEAEARAGRSLEDQQRYDNLRVAQEQRREMLEEDPLRYLEEFGPKTPAQKRVAEAGPLDLSMLLSPSPAERERFNGLLNDRRVALDEGAGLFGNPTGKLLRPAEIELLRNGFKGSDINGRIELAKSLAQLSSDNMQAVFDQLSLGGSMEGYALPAAGAAYASGSAQAAQMIIESSAAASEPAIREYVKDGDLHVAMREYMPLGLDKTITPGGRKNLMAAAANLYAYQAALQGLDTTSVDKELLETSVNLVMGGTLTTDFGSTRVRPPRGLSVEDFNTTLRRSDATFWQRKLDETGQRFDIMGRNVTGEGLNQALRRGDVWLSNSRDGSGDYLLMTTVTREDGTMAQTILRDEELEPIRLDIGPGDYLATPISSAPAGTVQARRERIRGGR